MPVLHEIAPLGENDFMYLADRHKRSFDYPLHCHDVFELNFVEHAEGSVRVVGDSSEMVGDYDLVLITSPNLEHAWLQGNCVSNDIHEITIQFRLNTTSGKGVFETNAYQPIKKLFQRAQKGLVFPLQTIMLLYPRLIRLSSIKEGFYAAHELIALLYELSKSEGARELSSNAFARVEADSESRRVKKVKSFINEHYIEELRLDDLSAMVNMAPTAFSRFFKLRTGKTLAEYIVDVRLGHAARLLVDTSEPISEVCFECGFNTLSNFNRLFRKRKGCSPTEFREKYVKTKVII